MPKTDSPVDRDCSYRGPMLFMRNLRMVPMLFAVALLAGCGGVRPTPSAMPQANMPRSVSPAMVKAAPMARTAVLPASAMQSRPRTMSAAVGPNWTQLPGSASQVVASPDGSIWVLSTQPSGPDKYIWHYASGTWTNISGLAAHLAVAPNYTLYAVNSGGGTYAYSSGTWSALGGGASAITAASDGSIYVLSNGGTGDQAIWHNVSGVWSQVPGAGVALGASLDQDTFTVPGGTISTDGLYILNSGGSIYYENSNGSFASLPANASAIAPTTIGGVYVLGYPANSGGNTIYYYDLNTPGWSAQSGAGVGISANSANLYVIGASGGIYSSPIIAAPTWTFGGSAANVVATQGKIPTAGTLAAYQNIALTVQFAQVVSGSGTLNLSDAINSGDISPNTLPADNATSGFSPLIYVSIYNGTNADISFGSTTPQLQVTDSAGFGGKITCELDVYGNDGSSQKSWQSVIGASGTISGTSVTIPSVVLSGSGSNVDFHSGQDVAAVSCK